MLQKVTHAGQEDFAAVVLHNQRAHEVAQHFPLSVGHLSHPCWRIPRPTGAANKSPAGGGCVLPTRRRALEIISMSEPATAGQCPAFATVISSRAVTPQPPPRPAASPRSPHP